MDVLRVDQGWTTLGLEISVLLFFQSTTHTTDYFGLLFCLSVDVKAGLVRKKMQHSGPQDTESQDLKNTKCTLQLDNLRHTQECLTLKVCSVRPFQAQARLRETHHDQFEEVGLRLIW